MANLSFDGGSSDSNSDKYLGDNIWYNSGVIKKATDTSDKVVDFGNAQVKYDIAVELEIAIEGLQYPKTMTVSGNFKKDHTGQVIDWGGAFKIQKLFQAAGVTGELDNNKLTPAILSSLVDREVAFLNYKNTKGKYSSWSRIYPVNAPKEVMKKDFLKDRARIDKGGWTNNYDSGDSMPNQVTNGSTQEAWMQKDDLPQGNLTLGSNSKFMG
tara:strand:- start:785 stop:1420 length:636 start_codon:yes stop_codon:yes gene_type:complete